MVLKMITMFSVPDVSGENADEVAVSLSQRGAKSATVNFWHRKVLDLTMPRDPTGLDQPNPSIETHTL